MKPKGDIMKRNATTGGNWWDNSVSRNTAVKLQFEPAEILRILTRISMRR